MRVRKRFCLESSRPTQTGQYPSLSQHLGQNIQCSEKGKGYMERLDIQSNAVSAEQKSNITRYVHGKE